MGPTFYKKYSLAFAVCFLALLINYWAMVQHWKPALVVQRILFVAVMILYGLRYSSKEKPKIRDSVKAILITVWCVFYLLTDLPRSLLFLFVYGSMLLGCTWFVLETIALIKNKGAQFNFLLFLGALILALEWIIRFLHAPFGSITHLTALFVLMLGFLAELLISRKEPIPLVENPLNKTAVVI